MGGFRLFFPKGFVTSQRGAFIGCSGGEREIVTTQICNSPRCGLRSLSRSCFIWVSFASNWGENKLVSVFCGHTDAVLKRNRHTNGRSHAPPAPKKINFVYKPSNTFQFHFWPSGMLFGSLFPIWENRERVSIFIYLFYAAERWPQRRNKIESKEWKLNADWPVCMGLLLTTPAYSISYFDSGKSQKIFANRKWNTSWQIELVQEQSNDQGHGVEQLTK